jgi:hypothetical protein
VSVASISEGDLIEKIEGTHAPEAGLITQMEGPSKRKVVGRWTRVRDRGVDRRAVVRELAAKPRGEACDAARMAKRRRLLGLIEIGKGRVFDGERDGESLEGAVGDADDEQLGGDSEASAERRAHRFFWGGLARGVCEKTSR